MRRAAEKQHLQPGSPDPRLAKNLAPYRPANFAQYPRHEEGNASLVALSERIALTLSVARGLTIAGREVQLAGLQDGIGLLCAQALDLRLEDARALRPALAEMLAQVDSLSLAIRDSFERRCMPD
jgi:hypothetical protein